MKLTAQAVAFSSVVGSSIMLLNEAGACVGMLGLMNATEARTPEEMTAMVSAELKKWTTVVEEAHIPKQ